MSEGAGEDHTLIHTQATPAWGHTAHCQLTGGAILYIEPVLLCTCLVDVTCAYSRASLGAVTAHGRGEAVAGHAL